MFVRLQVLSIPLYNFGNLYVHIYNNIWAVSQVRLNLFAGHFWSMGHVLHVSAPCQKGYLWWWCDCVREHSINVVIKCLFQILSTSIGPPIQHSPVIPPVPDISTPQPPPNSASVEPMAHSLLYSQSQNVISPVPLYSQPVPLYSHPQNTVPPVTLYSQSIPPITTYSQSQTTTSFSISSTSSTAYSTDQSAVSTSGVMIPSHYFYQDGRVS
jgi:hypothetical protein